MAAGSVSHGQPGQEEVTDAMDDAVAVRTLLVQAMPLVVADVPDRGRGTGLRARIGSLGLAPLGGFLGVQLPRGARLAVHLTPTELLLVAEDETTLLRAQRSGIDGGWAVRARALRGTMLVVTRGLELDAVDDEAVLVVALDAAGRAGDALGAIVGVHEEPRRLPLIV